MGSIVYQTDMKVSVEQSSQLRGICAQRAHVAFVRYSPDTSSSPDTVPYRAPASRLRLSVPGTANVCMKT